MPDLFGLKLQNLTIRFPNQTQRRAKASSIKLRIANTFRKLAGYIDPEVETSKWAIAYKKYGIYHWVLLASIITYAIVGAGIFHAIEGKSNEKDEKSLTTAYVVKDLVQLLCQNVTLECNSSIKAQLTHQFYALIADGKIKLPYYVTWNFFESMYYATTLFTTIGYGHYVPQSTEGKVATMIYSFFGIPLMLTVLNDIGKLLTDGISWNWNWARECCWENRKYKEKLTVMAQYARQHSNVIKLSPSADSHSKLNKPYSPFLPVLGIFIVLTLLVLAVGKILCMWENQWDYFTSLYFLFISISTIGLGDVVLDHPNKDMLFLLPFGVLSLALMTAAVNQMQQAMAQTFGVLTQDDFLDTQSSSDEDTPNLHSQQDAASLVPVYNEANQSINGRRKALVEQIRSNNLLRQVHHGIEHNNASRKSRRRQRGVQTDECYIMAINPRTKISVV